MSATTQGWVSTIPLLLADRCYTLQVLHRDVGQQRDEQSGYQIVDPSRRQVQLRTRKRFDRIAFAMKVLDIIKPAEKVVLYRRRHELVVERGTQIQRGRVQRYALVGIPLGASQHQIAYELACLVGLERLPFSVSALVAKASGQPRRRD